MSERWYVIYWYIDDNGVKHHPQIKISNKQFPTRDSRYKEANILITSIHELLIEKFEKKYELPVLIDYDGDLTKKWYIKYFYLGKSDKWFFESESIISKNFPAEKERRAEASRLIAEITPQLENYDKIKTDLLKLSAKPIKYKAIESAVPTKRVTPIAPPMGKPRLRERT